MPSQFYDRWNRKRNESLGLSCSVTFQLVRLQKSILPSFCEASLRELSDCTALLLFVAASRTASLPVCDVLMVFVAGAEKEISVILCYAARIYYCVKGEGTKACVTEK